MTETKPNPTPAHFAHLRDRFVTIVAFGDSLTQVNHWTYGHLNWVGLLSMGLYEVFPHGHVIINSGLSGNRLVQALERLDRDVLRYHPDIVVICYGMNDCRHVTPAEFADQLTEVVRRIRENSGAQIVLRTPNPMINMLSGGELCELPGLDGKPEQVNLAAYVQVIRDVAEREKTLLVDHYGLWKQSMQSSCIGDLIMLMGNPLHPNHLGHRRLYHEIAPVFGAFRHFYYEWERVLRDQGSNL